ncbi:MAG: helix-turn-helix domain-containing protein [Candidatus Babeliales bacterium]
MSLSLEEFLKTDLKKIIKSFGKNENGNVYSLVVQEVEKTVISLVLTETNHNYLHASKILGISRSTLYRKIKSLGL